MDLISKCDTGTGMNCAGIFNTNYKNFYSVKNFDGSVSYSGLGWQVYVPVVYSGGCPPGNLNQPHQIATYAKIVITQIINHGWCGVANHTTLKDPTGKISPNPWDSLCPPPNGTAAKRDPNLRALFAFYDCGAWEANSVVIPAPRVALANRLRLVQ